MSRCVGDLCRVRVLAVQGALRFRWRLCGHCEKIPRCVWIEVGAGVDPKGPLGSLAGRRIERSVRVELVVALVDREECKQPRLQAHEGYRVHLESVPMLYLRSAFEADTTEESEAWGGVSQTMARQTHRDVAGGSDTKCARCVIVKR